MITIYGAYNYPESFHGLFRDLRPLWAAEELELEYRIHWLDPMKGEHREAEARMVSPFGKIPALVDGDFALFESGAMVNYLFEKAGSAPADLRERALLAQWCYAALNTLEPPLLELAVWDLYFPADRPGREVRRPELVALAKERLAALDAALGERPYLLGGELSPADILLVSVLRFGRVEPGLLTETPRVAGYLARCEARPAFVRALAVQGGGPGRRATDAA